MRFAILVIGMVAVTASAFADPIEWPAAIGGDGHYYEVVHTAEPLTWIEADALAKTMSYNGMSGHLATIADLLQRANESWECSAFLSQLTPCELYPYFGCDTVFLGGWSVVTEVIEQPEGPPYVRTAPCQWITGEVGGSAYTWGGEVGQGLCLVRNLYNPTGFGLPSYGEVYFSESGSWASAFMVEYDGIVPFRYPPVLDQFTNATGDFPGLDDIGSGNSVAWLDFDHDGDLDLSVGAGANNTNRLFLNRLAESGAVSFDMSSDPLIANSNTTRGLGWGVFGGSDLCPDLYQGLPFGDNILLNNTCGNVGNVTNIVTAGSSAQTNGVRVVDFDRDGRLDIHELRPDAPDRLLRNLGNWQFEEVPSSALNIVDGSFDAAWGDVDGDGDQDVYVTRESPWPNVLLRNDGSGAFAEVTPPLLAITDRSQGATWGDYDNDGDLDLFVTDWQAPNHLFRNDGAFIFTDVTVPAMDVVRRGQSAVWGDLNNDGWLDLYVANQGDPNQLWLNVPDGAGARTFEDVTCPTVANLGPSTGVGMADYDQDGDLDIYVGAHLGANTLLRHELTVGNHWLEVDLVPSISNGSAIGTRITLTAGEQSVIREVGANNGIWSQEPLRPHFGLGTHAGLVQLVIRWPSGIVQQLADVVPDQRLTVTEPPQHLRYVATDGDDAANGTALHPLRTIQRAVDVAAAGDTVIIRDGTYSGPGNVAVTWQNKNLAIRSESNNRAQCVIECAGSAGITFVDSIMADRNSLSLCGFTIVGASTAVSALGGEPWYANWPLAVTVSNVCIRNGHDGLSMLNCTAAIDNAVICENADAGISSVMSRSVSMQDCSLRDNGIGLNYRTADAVFVSVVGSDFVSNGIGIQFGVERAEVALHHCRVDSNGTGDGINVRGYTCFLDLADCSVSGNARSGIARAGEVLLSTTAARCNIDGNGTHGIALNQYWGYLQLDDVTLSNNHGWGFCGGTTTDDVPPANLPMMRDSSEATTFNTLQISNCEIRGNGAGGLWTANWWHETGLAMANTVATDNGGPGLLLERLSSDLGANELIGATIAGNEAGVIIVPNDTPIDLHATRTLISRNSGAAVDLPGGTSLTLMCSDIFGNTGGDWCGPIATQLGANGNVSVEPRFCDANNGDYHLQYDSPLAAANYPECGTIGAYDATCPAQPWAPFEPHVRDVSGDQGGQLRVSWLKHGADSASAAVPITGYDVQRHGTEWQTIATMQAASADSYAVTVATTDILTIGQPAPYSRYRLLARTALPAVFYSSGVDSAYSVDNLAPPRPTAMLVDAPDYRYIFWTNPEIPDSASACVFRGEQSGFTPDEPITCPSSGFFAETHLAWYFYRVQFSDTHGNLSEFSDELHGQFPTDVPGALPTVLRLYPCRPNPFNPRTTIKYDLPESGPVRLSVFDLAGRLVRTLVDGSKGQGAFEAVWDGRDSSGREVGSGTYLARLSFGGRVESIRMGLVR